MITTIKALYIIFSPIVFLILISWFFSIIERINERLDKIEEKLKC